MILTQPLFLALAVGERRYGYLHRYHHGISCTSLLVYEFRVAPTNFSAEIQVKGLQSEYQDTRKAPPDSHPRDQRLDGYIIGFITQPPLI